jgi:hypothetical protein
MTAQHSLLNAPTPICSAVSLLAHTSCRMLSYLFGKCIELGAPGINCFSYGLHFDVLHATQAPCDRCCQLACSVTPKTMRLCCITLSRGQPACINALSRPRQCFSAVSHSCVASPFASMRCLALSSCVSCIEHSPLAGHHRHGMAHTPAQLDKKGGGARAEAEHVLAELVGARAGLAALAPTREKQGAKAAMPKSQRLVNDATAAAITSFCEKFDAAVAELEKTHLPRAESLVAAVGCTAHA